MLTKTFVFRLCVYNLLQSSGRGKTVPNSRSQEMILYCITVKHTCSKFEELEIEIDSALHSAGRCWEVLRFDNMMIEMVRVDP